MSPAILSSFPPVALLQGLCRERQATVKEHERSRESSCHFVEKLMRHSWIKERCREETPTFMLLPQYLLPSEEGRTSAGQTYTPPSSGPLSAQIRQHDALEKPRSQHKFVFSDVALVRELTNMAMALSRYRECASKDGTGGDSSSVSSPCGGHNGEVEQYLTATLVTLLLNAASFILRK